MPASALLKLTLPTNWTGFPEPSTAVTSAVIGTPAFVEELETAIRKYVSATVTEAAADGPSF
jgi:hypothetical protein